MSLRIQGYAAVFDRVDRAGDVFRSGVFADAVPVPLLMQHRGAPVGEIWAIGEDARGLWIEACVVDPDVARMVRGGGAVRESTGATDGCGSCCTMPASGRCGCERWPPMSRRR